ncbi:hypothetical protein [Sphingobacterium suaedae]|uniref:DUF5668 domain-containing protein n=1 Tax=Sphingobacterium suaedae TaxID=1686402 RepID=A0ABW5KGN3_9SPHI
MKLTPLNIVLACFLTWMISEWGNDQLHMSWWWVVIFVIVVVLTDVLFRSFVKDVKKLWYAQMGFILMTSIVVVFLRILGYSGA